MTLKDVQISSQDLSLGLESSVSLENKGVEGTVQVRVVLNTELQKLHCDFIY